MKGPGETATKTDQGGTPPTPGSALQGFDPSLIIPRQVRCHLACHGVALGAERYATEEELAPLKAVTYGTMAAVVTLGATAYVQAAVVGGRFAATLIEIQTLATEDVPIPVRLTTPIGKLRDAGIKDAHHVAQDRAVRDIPGYDTNAVPGVSLAGPSTKIGSPHYIATQIQRQRGGGTLAAEMRIGYKGIRRAGYTEADARQVVAEIEEYFRSIGATPSTPTYIPRNRK